MKTAPLRQTTPAFVPNAGHFGRLARILHSPSMERVWSRIGEGLCRYFRVEISGLHHVPKHGPVIVIANHSGYAGADAIVLAHILQGHRSQGIRILAHRAFFDIISGIACIPWSFGLRRATYRTGLKQLREGAPLMLFPEAEFGNFKSSFKRYRLQPFHCGFVRMAIATGAPVVPCVITGAEESHWNLGSFRAPIPGVKLRLPIPLNLFPIPAKWRIRFLPPLHDPVLKALTPRNREGVQLYAELTRRKLQKELEQAVEGRDYVFVPLTVSRMRELLRGALRRA